MASLHLVTSKYVKAARDAFVHAFTALEAAEKAVDVAEDRLRRTTDELAVADAAQDDAVITLASRLAGDGFNRANPLKSFGVPAPAKLVGLNVLDEAATLIALAPKVAAHPKVSAESKRAAAKMYEAAIAARTASNEREVALRKRADAVDTRDRSLPKQVRAALVDLKAAVRYADFTEQTTHYISVFRGSTKVRSGKKAQRVEERPVS